ncbi:hypothetical protein CSW98_13120 [Vibrio sp. HA2012]|uniref:hypothetical protein n=1 Tax=Vibrio sp. HA2012 TaxID=1971595 RepID=UPI000C2CBF9F|nr:hypothetical protein [Vibrio sp. HA2012]PJC85969.1 hypothetical protein CSW98_13120 [Vibrio sp. HA2012]
MKKLLLASSIISSIALTGCQLTGDKGTDIVNADFANMSCAEIEQTFESYKNQMDNLDTGTSLLSTVGIDSGTSEAKQVMLTGYEKARKVATPIIKAKNCSINI